MAHEGAQAAKHRPHLVLSALTKISVMRKSDLDSFEPLKVTC